MKRAVIILLRLGLGGVFIVAGVMKIVNPAQFASDITNYRLLPHEWINLFAIILPWIEVLAGSLLALGAWSRASAALIAMMLVMFLIAISQAVARGLNINCGCFGTLEGRKVGLTALAQDVVMLGVAAWLLCREKDRERPHP
jgi:putative oxidoreductase